MVFSLKKLFQNNAQNAADAILARLREPVAPELDSVLEGYSEVVKESIEKKVWAEFYAAKTPDAKEKIERLMLKNSLLKNIQESETNLKEKKTTAFFNNVAKISGSVSTSAPADAFQMAVAGLQRIEKMRDPHYAFYGLPHASAIEDIANTFDKLANEIGSGNAGLAAAERSISAYQTAATAYDLLRDNNNSRQCLIAAKAVAAKKGLSLKEDLAQHIKARLG